MAQRRRNPPRRGARYAALLDVEDASESAQPPRHARHGAGPYQPNAGTYGRARQRRMGGGRAAAGKAPALIALVALAAMAGGGIWFWHHRPVGITVNGTVAEVPINTTIAEARERLSVRTTPGNLVSVGGTVLEAEAGEPYSVRVNGRDVSIADARDWQLQGGEDIELGTGADVMEEYSVELRETQPKLVFDGEWGSISYIAQWGRVRRQEVRTGARSGEVADGDVLEEGRDCVVRMSVPVPKGDEQLVALTFDDGPSVYTQSYLDILSHYGAHATFFNLSTEQEDMPEVARAIIASGNEIMSHTNQHLQLTALSGEEMLHEITSAAEVIERVTGVRTTSIRPPYGDFSRECWLQSQGTVSLSVLWTQDSEDWRRQGVGVIVDKALSGVGNGSIILMHDGGGNRDMDVEALPEIIEGLQESGYKLVTISEMLAACPDVPSDVASGYAPMPADAAWPEEIA